MPYVGGYIDQPVTINGQGEIDTQGRGFRVSNPGYFALEGSTPSAQSGIFRVHNDFALLRRNAANSADLTDFSTSSNSPILGNASTTVLTRIGFAPPKDTGSTQSDCRIYGGAGAPADANGQNGDIYLRSDGGAGTTVYQRRAGVWTGLV